MKFENVIFAIDFDGTCVTHEYPEVGRDIGAVPVLKDIIKEGGKLVTNTMRSGDKLVDALKWFEANEIELSGIQEAPGQEDWTSSPKVYANVYIDDAALGCPLIYIKPEQGQKAERPYVDWVTVRQYLGL